MFGKLVGPDIAEMIQQRQFAQLRSALLRLTPPTVAEIFEDMSPEDIGVQFRLLPREFAADIFEYLNFETQESLLHSLGNEQVAAVLNEMAPDDRTALLEELPGAVTKRLLTLLAPGERRIATELLGYPPKTIGRLMTPDYVAVSPDWTVGEVLEHIRKVGRDKETLNVIYVVDSKGYLIDDIRLREIVLWELDARLSDRMNLAYIALRADQHQEEAVKAFKEYDRVALPVVDSSGLLVGIVTVDDVLDIQEEEVTEDIQKMGAVQALDAPYADVPFLTMVRKRAIPLSFLFLGGTFTASAMGFFKTSLDRAEVLALFVPLIIGSGGNSGSQASSLIVRALALGEVCPADWWRVLVREWCSGIALGSVLGIIVLLGILFWPWRAEAFGVFYARLGLTVAFAILFVVTYGTLAGAMLPLFLRRVGLDPAVSSAPFVATLVDVSGIVIYFTVAQVFLRGTLL